jgi:hypothetical protein
MMCRIIFTICLSVARWEEKFIDPPAVRGELHGFRGDSPSKADGIMEVARNSVHES